MTAKLENPGRPWEHGNLLEMLGDTIAAAELTVAFPPDMPVHAQKLMETLGVTVRFDSSLKA